jgi:hypothetical protein
MADAELLEFAGGSASAAGRAKVAALHQCSSRLNSSWMVENKLRLDAMSAPARMCKQRMPDLLASHTTPISDRDCLHDYIQVAILLLQLFCSRKCI